MKSLFQFTVLNFVFCASVCVLRRCLCISTLRCFLHKCIRMSMLLFLCMVLFLFYYYIRRHLSGWCATEWRKLSNHIRFNFSWDRSCMHFSSLTLHNFQHQHKPLEFAWLFIDKTVLHGSRKPIEPTASENIFFYCNHCNCFINKWLFELCHTDLNFFKNIYDHFKFICCCFLKIFSDLFVILNSYYLETDICNIHIIESIWSTRSTYSHSLRQVASKIWMPLPFRKYRMLHLAIRNIFFVYSIFESIVASFTSQ